MQEQKKKKTTNLFQLLKNRYTLPEESKVHIGQNNMRIGYNMALLVIIFSASLFTYVFFKGETDIRVYIYYGVMLVVSLAANRIFNLLGKKENYYLSQVFLIIILCLLLMVLQYNFFCSPHYASGLVGTYIFYLGIIICFEINPIFHIIIVSIFAGVFACYHTIHGLYISILINNTLFCISIVLLSLYKRSTLVKRKKQIITIKEQNKLLEANNIELERQKDSLLLNKQNLEKFVHNQSEELHVQNERIIRIQNNTIISLSNLVENRDEDTGYHVLRTRDYVELIALKAYLSGEFPELTEDIVRLYIKAAPMHDIGKIVVPDDVLKKPGKLSPEEFELIKLHTTKGGSIVEDVLGAAEDKDYVRITKEIATYHHERYDGTGYPYGLKGKDIPLSARVMAIADVFDALVSPRCYKTPFPLEDAFKIIKESAGTHFDPVLTKIFVDSKEEVIEIHNKYM